MGFQVCWFGIFCTAATLVLGVVEPPVGAQDLVPSAGEVPWGRTGLVAIGCRPKGRSADRQNTWVQSPPTRMSWGVLWDRQGHVLVATDWIHAPREYDFEAWRLLEDGHWQYVDDVQWVGGDPWTGFAVLKLPLELPGAESIVAGSFGEFSSERTSRLHVPGDVRFWLSSDERPSFPCEVTAAQQRGLYAAGETVEHPRWIYDYGGMIEIRSLVDNQRLNPGPAFGVQGECLGWVLPWRWERPDSESELLIIWNRQLTRVVDELAQGRRPEFGFLGVRPREISEAVRKQVNFGVSVYEVGQRTPAQSAGLQFGDVITHVNDQEVRSSQALLWSLGMLAPLEPVELRVVRGARSDRAKTSTVKVTLAKRYIPDLGIGLVETTSFDGIEVDWATASPRFSKDWQKIDPRGAVAVIRVDESSAAWQAGLREGDFISEGGGRHVDRPKDFETCWSQVQGDVELRVNSGPNQLARVLRFPRKDSVSTADSP
jgi:hypothetical protein